MKRSMNPSRAADERIGHLKEARRLVYDAINEVTQSQCSFLAPELLQLRHVEDVLWQLTENNKASKGGAR